MRKMISDQIGELMLTILEQRVQIAALLQENEELKKTQSKGAKRAEKMLRESVAK